MLAVAKDTPQVFDPFFGRSAKVVSSLKIEKGGSPKGFDVLPFELTRTHVKDADPSTSHADLAASQRDCVRVSSHFQRVEVKLLRAVYSYVSIHSRARSFERYTRHTVRCGPYNPGVPFLSGDRVAFHVVFAHATQAQNTQRQTEQPSHDLTSGSSSCFNGVASELRRKDFFAASSYALSGKSSICGRVTRLSAFLDADSIRSLEYETRTASLVMVRNFRLLSTSCLPRSAMADIRSLAWRANISISSRSLARPTFSHASSDVRAISSEQARTSLIIRLNCTKSLIAKTAENAATVKLKFHSDRGGRALQATPSTPTTIVICIPTRIRSHTVPQKVSVDSGNWCSFLDMALLLSDDRLALLFYSNNQGDKQKGKAVNQNDPHCNVGENVKRLKESSRLFSHQHAKAAVYSPNCDRPNAPYHSKPNCCQHILCCIADDFKWLFQPLFYPNENRRLFAQFIFASVVAFLILGVQYARWRIIPQGASA